MDLKQSISSITKHTRVSSILAVFLFIISFFVLVSRINLPIHFDEAYQALSCTNYSNSPLAMMLFFCGQKWISVVGDNLINMRILSCMCYIFSIAIGCLYLWHNTKNLLLTSSICLLSAIFSNLADNYIFNWDTGALPIEALGTLLLLLYISKPNYNRLFLVSIVGGIMIAFRIPLIGFFGLIMIAVIGKERNINAVYKLFLAFFLMIIAWIACAIIMTGSIPSYLSSFSADNIITGHTTGVFNNYINQYRQFFKFQVLASLITIICILFGFILYSNKTLSLKKFLVIELLLAIIVHAISTIFSNSGVYFFWGIGIPLFCTLIFWRPIAKTLGIQHSSINKNLELVLLFSSMILEGFGSDTFYQRWSVAFVLPMCVGVVWPTLSTKSKNVFKLILLVSLPALFVSISLKTKFEQYNHIQIKNTNKLNGILASPKLLDHLNKLRRATDLLTENKIKFTFAGYPSRYIYSYEFEPNNDLSAPLHMYHWPESYADKSLDKITKRANVIFYTSNFPVDFNYLQTHYNYKVLNTDFSVILIAPSVPSEVIDNIRKMAD